MSALVAATFLTGCAEESTQAKVDLNSMTIEEITEKAKEDGEVNSVGMPDTWANWVETWTELEDEYGIKHTDTDMSSAEELAILSEDHAEVFLLLKAVLFPSSLLPHYQHRRITKQVLNYFHSSIRSLYQHSKYL